MVECRIDRSHHMDPRWLSNEIGRWYTCLDCGTTLLRPNLRYRLLLSYIRIRRVLARALPRGA